MNITVGISDMKMSDNPEDMLITYSLGSCIGLTLYDPEIRLGAMIHCLLPLSRTDKEKAAKNPYMFTDTGVAAMLQQMYNRGAQPKRLIAKAAGAAAPLKSANMFKVGERNFTVLRKLLWKNNILLAAHETGGSEARTLCLYIDSGRTVIRSGGKEREL